MHIPGVLAEKVVKHRGEDDGQKQADEEPADVAERLPEQVGESPEHYADEAEVSITMHDGSS